MARFTRENAQIYRKLVSTRNSTGMNRHNVYESSAQFIVTYWLEVGSKRKTNSEPASLTQQSKIQHTLFKYDILILLRLPAPWYRGPVRLVYSLQTRILMKLTYFSVELIEMWHMSCVVGGLIEMEKRMWSLSSDLS